MAALFKRTLYFILLFGIGCKGLSDDNIIGPYYLVAVDGNDNMTLSYSVNEDNSSFVGLVKPCVFAAGYNNKYIFIKQHPVLNDKFEKRITNYYFVPIYKKNDYFPEIGIIGPLTLGQFNEKRKELNISDSVKFTTVIKELE